MDAGYEAPASTGQVFPRVKERDPCRRLGISSEATYEEVQDARNYLVDAYRSHTAGVEAIEAAFDRIIQEKLTSRKKAKGMKQALRKRSRARITCLRFWSGCRRHTHRTTRPSSAAR